MRIERWQDRVVEHHDYIWARLPFIVPMALAVARRRADHDADALVRDLFALRPIVLDHLSREERAHAQGSARAIRDRLHDDHLAVAELLAHLRVNAAEVAAHDTEPDATAHALLAEIAQLDVCLAEQIILEEKLLAAATSYR